MYPRVVTGPVLVIEDDDQARDSLQRLLHSWGHETYAAEDGTAGVELALQLRPRVVLSDINLPRLDGYAVARRLRSEFGSDIVLIAQTGEDDPSRERAAGFDAHVSKPLDLSRLRFVLENDGT